MGRELTDEQIAEGLALAAQGAKEDPADFMALLALVLQAERDEARKELKEANSALAYYRDAEAHAAVCTVGPAARREAFEEAARAVADEVQVLAGNGVVCGRWSASHLEQCVRALAEVER